MTTLAGGPDDGGRGKEFCWNCTKVEYDSEQWLHPTQQFPDEHQPAWSEARCSLSVLDWRGRRRHTTRVSYAMYVLKTGWSDPLDEAVSALLVELLSPKLLS